MVFFRSFFSFPYVVSLDSSLMRKNKGNFFMLSLPLGRASGGRSLRFPVCVGIDVHGSSYIGVAQKLLYILGCCTVGQQIGGADLRLVPLAVVPHTAPHGQTLVVQVDVLPCQGTGFSDTKSGVVGDTTASGYAPRKKLPERMGKSDRDTGISLNLLHIPMIYLYGSFATFPHR